MYHAPGIGAATGVGSTDPCVCDEETCALSLPSGAGGSAIINNISNTYGINQ